MGRVCMSLGVCLGLLGLSGCAAGAGLGSARPPLRGAWRAYVRTSPVPELGEATVEACVAFAEKHSPGLRAARARWQATWEQVAPAGALPDPRLGLGVFLEGVETRVGPQQWTLGLSQTFPWRGKRGLRARMALESAHAAWYRYEAERLALGYRVRNAWHERRYLAAAIRTLERNVEIVEHLEQVVTARYKASQADYGAVLRVQIQQSKLEDRLSGMRALRGPLDARLNAAMGRPPGAAITLPDAGPDVQEPLPADAQIYAAMFHGSPQLAALAHAVAARRHGVALAELGDRPDVTLGLKYIDTGHARMPNVFDSGKNPVLATLSMNLPLWAQKYRAAERQARARQDAAETAVEQKRNALGATAALALYGYHDAIRRAKLYNDALLPQARQALKTTETAYVAGKAGFQDMLDAERVLLEFGLAYERSLTDRAVRLAELKMLVGGVLPPPQSSEAPAEQPASTIPEGGKRP